MSRVRIEDVAAAANVSMKTVSRVLNREPNVREDTRVRVLEAVERLKYVPNVSARSLAGNKSFLIALLYNNPSGSYLLEVIRGVLAACEAHRYNMMLCPVDMSPKKMIEGVEELIAHSRPDGVVMTPPITDAPALIARLAELDIPTASISPKDRRKRAGAAMDEVQASLDIMAHLVSLGHRRIAHITGHPAHGATGWRLKGYREGLERAGLKLDPKLVVPGEFSFESGVRAAEALFALKRRPTAIFAANDDMAAGVIAAALQRKFDIPGDVSVCGFDDIPLARQIFPPLTTVHQPTHEMGRLATLELLATIHKRGSGRMLVVPHTMELRRSTGPAPS